MNSTLKIDLDCIRENINEYRLELGNNKKFCAVVKADCYGLGARKICSEIDDVVDYFAVATDREFFELKNRVSKPILLLDPIYKNITNLAKLKCEFCVSNFVQFEKIFKLAKINKNIKFKIHLAYNTGMNRFGFNSLYEIEEIFLLLQKAQNISIIGIFSHFYMGNNKNIAKMQVLKFETLIHFLSQKYDVKNIIFHMANTDGFEVGKNFDMSRVGLGMFLKNNKNTFKLTSKIIEIQSLNKNETAGYNLGFIANKKMKIAVVSIGYADGIFRSIAGCGFVLINGEFCKILAVCMDSMIVDISFVKTKIFDDVVIVGKSEDKQIFVCDIAKWCDTIEYEIMTRISKRVKRIYSGGLKGANHNRKV